MPRHASNVLAIILHYNHTDLTRNCLTSLRLQTQIPDVLILDNGSTQGDATTEIGDFLRPTTERLVTLQRGLGYAAAVNVGLRFALSCDSYEHILLLGNDTELEQNVVESLVLRVSEDVCLGAVAAVQVRMSNTEIVQSAGGILNKHVWIANHLHCGKNISDVRQARLPAPDWVDFATVLIPLDVIRHVGLLNEQYHFYWEDLDWSLRCRAFGYELLVDLNSIVRHHVGASTGRETPRMTYYLERNRFESASKFNAKGFVMQLWFREVVNVFLRNISTVQKRVQLVALYDFLRRQTYRY